MLSSMWVRNPTGFSPDASLPDLSNKTFFVTGATAGIGYETALALAKKSATVVIGARSEARARDAIASIKAQVPEANVEFIQMDLADLKTVADAARTFRTRHDKLDCLVNNAGIMAVPFEITKDGIESQFQTNHVGHFLLTRELLPALERAERPRIVNLSSDAHWWAPKPEGIVFDSINDENRMGTWARYGQSKLANILFTRGLHKRYGSRIYVNSVHPGFVSTELMRGPVSAWGSFMRPVVSLVFSVFKLAALRADQGAWTSLYVATSPDIVENGIKNQYFEPLARQSTNLSEVATDDKLAEALWAWTEKALRDRGL
ncbi:short chain dehydrogenase [Plasmodiophora brassicae]|uniref:Uncharacterized protein n=1 Tax=Plasmodiophora brassicae TaxID=37360 RepID=A0A0G4IW33_PLABS|nr:hypothetical protein PBRA_001358 [Plasmodiophora brassicae]SPQ97460.1 unnamed protein product [Plasmodiophora brassicae]